jgi:hypothetical protein
MSVQGIDLWRFDFIGIEIDFYLSIGGGKRAVFPV